MAVSDAVFLSTMVDGTLLVVNRRTPKPLVRKTRTRLSTPHTKVLGVLLNRVDIRTGEYGSYYAHYYEYYPHAANPGINGTNGNGHHRLNGHRSRASRHRSSNGHSGSAYPSLSSPQSATNVHTAPGHPSSVSGQPEEISSPQSPVVGQEPSVFSQPSPVATCDPPAPEHLTGLVPAALMT